MPSPLFTLPRYSNPHAWLGDRRCYRTPEGVFPGVTTVLGKTKTDGDRKGLSDWVEREGATEAERVITEGLTYGSATHALVECHLRKEKLPPFTAPEVEILWGSISPLLERVSNPILIESSVWHPSGYAGTIDCLAYWEGELALIDWKTSLKRKQKSWLTDYFIQLAAYKQALEWLYADHGLKISKAVVVMGLRSGCLGQKFELNLKELDHHLFLWNLRLRKYQREMGLEKDLLLSDIAPVGNSLLKGLVKAENPVKKESFFPNIDSTPLESRKRADTYKGVSIS